MSKDDLHALRYQGGERKVSLVSSENPHGYWCRKCGRSRAYAEEWCSSANCKERRVAEDLERECPTHDYRNWSMFEGPR